MFSALPGEEAQAVLIKVMADPRFDITVRRTALQALLRYEATFSNNEFRKFLLASSGDPVAQEASKAFAASGRK